MNNISKRSQSQQESRTKKQKIIVSVVALLGLSAVFPIKQYLHRKNLYALHQQAVSAGDSFLNGNREDATKKTIQVLDSIRASHFDDDQAQAIYLSTAMDYVRFTGDAKQGAKLCQDVINHPASSRIVPVAKDLLKEFQASDPTANAKEPIPTGENLVRLRKLRDSVRSNPESAKAFLRANGAKD